MASVGPTVVPLDRNLSPALCFHPPTCHLCSGVSQTCLTWPKQNSGILYPSPALAGPCWSPHLVSGRSPSTYVLWPWSWRPRSSSCPSDGLHFHPVHWVSKPFPHHFRPLGRASPAPHFLSSLPPLQHPPRQPRQIFPQPKSRNGINLNDSSSLPEYNSKTLMTQNVLRQQFLNLPAYGNPLGEL